MCLKDKIVPTILDTQIDSSNAKCQASFHDKGIKVLKVLFLWSYKMHTHNYVAYIIILFTTNKGNKLLKLDKLR